MNEKWNVCEPPKNECIFGQYQNVDGWNIPHVYWWEESEQGWVCQEDDMIYYLPPERWREPPSEADLMSEQLLTNITTIADLAETLPEITKKLADATKKLADATNYYEADVELYNNLSMQWNRAFNSMLFVENEKLLKDNKLTAET